MIHDIVVVSGFVSTALAIYCSIPYLVSIVNGKTKPHQLSWLIFTIMNAIVAFSQYAKGARASVLISFVFLFFSALIFLLSLKKGVRDTSRFDTLLFMVCLGTIVVWYLTKNASIAIWLTVVIDILATTMIILKIKHEPSSEALGPWLLGAAAYVFTCTALLDKPFGILYVRPVYGLLSDLAIVVAIYLYAGLDKKNRIRIEITPSMES